MLYEIVKSMLLAYASNQKHDLSEIEINEPLIREESNMYSGAKNLSILQNNLQNRDSSQNRSDNSSGSSIVGADSNSGDRMAPLPN